MAKEDEIFFLRGPSPCSRTFIKQAIAMHLQDGIILKKSEEFR